jgi:hypothetical protein
VSGAHLLPEERRRMRKIVMMVVLVAMLVAILAPAALAANFTCSSLPCFGTVGDDNIQERPGTGVSDDIRGFRGSDGINAQLYGSDTDVLQGQRGPDVLRAADRDTRDTLRGGRGFDRCFGDGNFGAGGDEYFSCEEVNGIPTT